MIDWESNESHIMINPRLTSEEQEKARKHLNQFPGHVWIRTSGTSGVQKWVALSKQAILVSADAVNKHVQSTSKDTWLHTLPEFHVGGLGIWARAYQSGAQVIRSTSKWDPNRFHQQTEEATLTALVPTQVYDLVTLNLSAPKSMRAVIVGGGALSSSLYQKGLALGWPLLPSYGLSECASQVATANPGSEELEILSHVSAKISDEGRVCLKSPSLLSTYAYLNDDVSFFDPKNEGWFETEDLGEIRGNTLTLLGRMTDVVKILGENVNLQDLEEKLSKIKEDQKFPGDFCLISKTSPRQGNALHLFVTEKADSLLEEFNQAVLPFERIENVHIVENIPRSELGKVLKAKLSAVISPSPTSENFTGYTG